MKTAGFPNRIFLFYLPSLPLGVCIYTFGTRAKISAQNSLGRRPFSNLGINEQKMVGIKHNPYLLFFIYLCNAIAIFIFYNKRGAEKSTSFILKTTDEAVFPLA